MVRPYTSRDVQGDSSRIQTTRTLHGTDARTLAVTAAKRLGKRLLFAPADAPPVVAEVNQGRWIAHCPDPTCSGAELCDPVDPMFWCLSCCNEAVGGRWLGVTFPADVAAVEAPLLVRPLVLNRNWTQGETVTDLEAENRQMEVMTLERAPEPEMN